MFYVLFIINKKQFKLIALLNFSYLQETTIITLIIKYINEKVIPDGDFVFIEKSMKHMQSRNRLIEKKIWITVHE
jgi:hypothetical protein